MQNSIAPVSPAFLRSESTQSSRCKFKLETDSKEYFLGMSDAVAFVAKKIEWEEVTVKGFLEPDKGFLEVEKISVARRNEPFMLATGPSLSEERAIWPSNTWRPKKVFL